MTIKDYNVLNYYKKLYSNLASTLAVIEMETESGRPAELKLSNINQAIKIAHKNEHKIGELK